MKRINIVSHDCRSGTLVCQNLIIRNIESNSDDDEEMMNLKTLVMKKRLSIQESIHPIKH